MQNPKETNEQTLLNAIRQNNIPTAIGLFGIPVLGGKLDPNRKAVVDLNVFRDARGYTALHVAIECYKTGVDNPGGSIVEHILNNYPHLIHQGSSDEHRVPPLHWAAAIGNSDVIPLLLQRGAVLDSVDSLGRTALMFAAFNDRLVVVEQLLNLKARFDIEDQTKDKGNALSYAIAGRKWNIVERLFPLFPPAVRPKFCQYAIEQDEVQLFRILLKLPYVPALSDLSGAKGKIKKLIDYKPARKEKNRSKYPSLGAYCTDIKSRNEAILLNFLYDEENTTDEDSSDSEDDEFQFIKETGSVDTTKIFARGVHFCPKFFNTKQRNATKTRNYHAQTVYSRATEELAQLLPKQPDRKVNFTQADQLVKGYFTMLKVTKDKPELTPDYKKKSRQLKGQEAQ